jgi:ribosomal protein L18
VAPRYSKESAESLDSAQARDKIFSPPRNTGFDVEISNKAGIAQLVERNLAKVEVASSSLVSRSIFLQKSVSCAFAPISVRKFLEN